MSLHKTRRCAAPLIVVPLLCLIVNLVAAAAARADQAANLAPMSLGGTGASSLDTGPAPAGSATVDLATGAATSTLPFQLPAARGQAQASLALTYNSANGVGFAGVGWTLSVPSIVRKGAAGFPMFSDRVITSASDPKTLAYYTDSDDYMIDGQLLLPICTVSGSACTNNPVPLPSGEFFPTTLAGVALTGYTYFRRELDDGSRYFLSPDGQTWLVQTPDLVLVFGSPVDGLGATFPGSVDKVDPWTATNVVPNTLPPVVSTVARLANPVYRWNLVRQSDASGNTVYYTYTYTPVPVPTGKQSPLLNFLSDIYDTPAVNTSPSALTPSSFAHHVHLTWKTITGNTYGGSDSPIWRALPFAELAGVDVTSAGWTTPARQLVRRYHLAYQSNVWGTRDYLASVSLEGACVTTSNQPYLENTSGLLPSTSCPTLPLVTYAYTPDEYGRDSANNVLPFVDDYHTGQLPVPWSVPTTRMTTMGAATNPATLLDIEGNGAADLIWSEVAPTATQCAKYGPSGGSACKYPPTATNLLATGSPQPGLTAPWQSLLPGQPYVIYGDWLSTGRVDLLFTRPGTAGCTGSGCVPNTFEAYTFTTCSDLGQYTTACTSSTPSTASGLAGWAFATPSDCSGNPACQAGRAFDVDGDGLVDMTLVPTGAPLQATYLSLRDSVGAIRPFGRTLAGAVLNTQLDPTAYGAGAIRMMADMDGDGLPDVVIAWTDSNNVVHLATFINRGDGRYGDGTPALNMGTSLGGPLSQTLFRMADLNGDGYADYVSLNSSGLNICIRKGVLLSAASFSCIGSSTPGFPAPAWSTNNGTCTLSGCPTTFDPSNSTLAVADVEGMGVPRVLYVAQTVQNTNGVTEITPYSALRFAPAAPKSGLLQSVTSLGGLTTTLKYQSLNTMNLTPPTSIPVTVWAVTSASTTNQLLGAQARTSTTTYAYNGPVYDPRDRAFLGFTQVQEFLPGFSRTTTFATAACYGWGLQPKACSGRDYGAYRMTRSVPEVVDERDPLVGELRTVVHQYIQQKLYTAMDNRLVRRLPLFQRMTFLWDPSNQPAQQQSFTAIQDESNSVLAQTPTMDTPASGTGAELMTQWNVDHLGVNRSTVDFGMLNVDQPIRTEMTAESVDATGWHYRVVFATTDYSADSTGQSLPPPSTVTRSYTYLYDSLGRLVQVLGSLAGETGLPTVAGVIRAPPGASVSSTVCLFGCQSTSPYDQYGNLTTVAGPNNRCSTIAYDASFAQLPQKVSSYPKGCGTGSPLISTLTYDRALERVTQRGAPSDVTITGGGRVTGMDYDAFGRLLHVYQPSVTLQGSADAVPSVIIAYADTGPIRIVSTQTVTDIPTSGSATYQAHLKYLDGFGDTVAALDQVNPAPGSTQWVLSGVHSRYSTGLVGQVWPPVFTGSQGASILNTTQNGLSVTLPPTPSTSTYDGAGRVVTRTDFNGKATKFQYAAGALDGTSSRRPTSVTVQDPEQLGGTHLNSNSQIFIDGHGRVVEERRNLSNTAAGSVVVTTDTRYQATGEPWNIIQSNPGGMQSYQRLLTYDSLGRLVSNAEPNTGGNEANWYYAYNDSGELVGSMDARGCGKDVYRDGLGRVIAEDYFPCSGSTPSSYSAPTFNGGAPTGWGAEAYFVFDANGQVSDEYDRAQYSHYTYDARGRVTSLQRQIASTTPSDPNSLQRYASTVFTKNFTQYTAANRLVSASTGADAPELTVNGSSVTASYTIQGSLESVTSTYGTNHGVLLASRSFDALGGVTQQTYGDQAGTNAAMGYDGNERLVGYVLKRPAGPWVTTYTYGGVPTSPDTLHVVLASLAITYDMVGNPRAVTQSTGGSSQTTAVGSMSLPAVDANWPAGAMPALSRNFTYWDDYRLGQATTSYYPQAVGGTDTFISPYVSSKDGNLYTSNAAASRVVQQNYSYDGRGNLTNSSDDLADYFDRSIGAPYILTGTTAGPDQFTAALELNGFTGGQVLQQYDAAGNVTRIHPNSLVYSYTWDELGRLSSASRKPSFKPTVSEQFTYDAWGRRVTATGPLGTTVNVFDSLVLKNAQPDGAGGYVHDRTDEQVYLNAAGGTFGHVVYDQAIGTSTGMPSAAGAVHVFMPMGDALGSTSFVVDHDTGELVEAPTYLAYGAVESDYRPARWQYVREDIRYTGQWDDAEVGLVYMGARYYSPQLGRFISPDPLSIHTASAANPYEYARSSPLRYVDPLGLSPNDTPTAPTPVCFIFCGGDGLGGGGGGWTLKWPWGGGGGGGNGGGTARGGGAYFPYPTPPMWFSRPGAPDNNANVYWDTPAANAQLMMTPGSGLTNSSVAPGAVGLAAFSVVVMTLEFFQPELVPIVTELGPAGSVAAGSGATVALEEGSERLEPVAAQVVDAVTPAEGWASVAEVPAAFSAAENAIVNEVKNIPLDQLRAAFQAGGGELSIGGRTILVDPGVPASGMTLFGENGFVLGRDAFGSDAELTQTLLHETYRLSTSQAAAGVSGGLAASETNAAFSFAQRAWSAFFQ